MGDNAARPSGEVCDWCDASAVFATVAGVSCRRHAARMLTAALSVDSDVAIKVEWSAFAEEA